MPHVVPVRLSAVRLRCPGVRLAATAAARTLECLRLLCMLPLEGLHLLGMLPL